MRLRSLSALALCTACLAIQPAYAAGVHVTDGWVRLNPVAGRPGAAYVTIQGGDVPDKLQSVTTPLARRAELHQHVHSGGVMRMEKVNAIDIPAGSTVTLQPGGLHIMLYEIRKRPAAGKTVPLTLTFARSGKQTVQLTIQPLGGAAATPRPEGPHHH